MKFRPPETMPRNGRTFFAVHKEWGYVVCEHMHDDTYRISSPEWGESEYEHPRDFACWVDEENIHWSDALTDDLYENGGQHD